MRKSWNVFLAVFMILIVIGTLAIAAGVYQRSLATTGTSTGTGSWTNEVKYASIELKRIWVQDCLAASNNVTITRVTEGNVYTQAVGTVSFSSGSAGSTPTFTAAYLKYGDKLKFSDTASTGATVMIEYEVQQ